MKRHFVTKSDIDALVDEGRSVLEVDAGTTVTDLAREYARQRGLTVRETHDAEPPAEAADRSGLRGAVRSAVIGRLGEVPAGLDEALDRVLGE